LYIIFAEKSHEIRKKVDRLGPLYLFSFLLTPRAPVSLILNISVKTEELSK